MAVTIEIPVSLLRATYGISRRQTGNVDVERFGIKYRGRQIKLLVFERYNMLHYFDDAECFASFQEIAAIDD